MKFRHLLRPVTRPLLALFAKYFIPRSEYEDMFARVHLQILQAESDATTRSAQRMTEATSLLEETLGAKVQDEARKSAQLTDDLRRLLEERFSLLGARTTELDTRATELKARTSELDTRATELKMRAEELERGAALDRQALHDLAHDTVSHRDEIVGQLGTVGVIIPTCDRPAALERALSSIASQTRKPDVVFVVNDGKEDVHAILDRFSQRLKITALKTPAPHSGSSAARNIALDALQTSLVAFLDDDNLMWSRWIERATEFLERDPLVDLVYGAQLRDVEESTVSKQWFLAPFDFERLKKGNFIDINQVMHRTTDLRFKSDLKRMVDWDYLLRLIGDSPERVVAVQAISSVYSAKGQDRITVPYWPPALTEIVASRRIGETMQLPEGHYACSCCGYEGVFSPGPRQRPNASCPRCGSLERHRFLQLVGSMIRTFWIPETRPHERTVLIEIAPSHATQEFRKLFGLATTFDADPAADHRIVDAVASLTDLPISPDAVDAALVLHVLEHIPDDRKAMAEIARTLRPTGIAILQVPLSGRSATEEEVLHTDEERLARYGQADHVRLYGNDLFARLAAAGLASEAVSPRESMPPEAVRKYGLLPDEALVFAVRANSPVALRRLSIFATRLRRGRL